MIDNLVIVVLTFFMGILISLSVDWDITAPICEMVYLFQSLATLSRNGSFFF